MGRLSGKIALITGAARGMGSAHVAKFVEEGALVVGTDILADEGAASIERFGERALFLEQDVTDFERWAEIVAQTERQFGPISILINNAGAGCYETLESSSIEAYRHCVDLNQFSVFYGMKAALPSMRKAGGGSIVNISSVMGMVSAAGVFPYSAAKFAVRGMSKAAAIELAPDNIRVNTVFPGSIRTPAFEHFISSADETADKLLTGNVPLARVGKIDDCTGMVLFLASDEASYCTGGDYVVDGGLTAH